ncbi:MAG: flagellar motor switch protein FliN [Chloroherpetonaceae bacterium]|nr:flagellar motor switch protein FliN [Chloroherpetonaceae bacterium]
MSDLTLSRKTALSDLFAALAPNLALALSEQMGQMVEIAPPLVDTVPVSDLLAFSETVAHTAFTLTTSAPVEGILHFTPEVARQWIALMEGSALEDVPEAPGEAQVTRLGTAVSGLLRGMAIALTNRTGETVDVEAATTAIGPLALPPVFAAMKEAIRITLEANIPEQPPATLTLLLAPEFVSAFLPEQEEPADPAVAGMPTQEELAGILGGMDVAGGAPVTPNAPGFPDWGGGSASGNAGADAGMPRGLDLILDIPLEVTVELGRVQMLIRDVLELSSGSIVELDRVAGEPVDLLVNGRLMARGEVVVIEDNFGIRITEIISPADRVAGLGKR